MTSLRTREERKAYLPASFFTRYFDMTTQTHNLHPILHEVHGPRLLEYEYIFVLVARKGHWASLWIDTTRRTIKYLDSYFQDGTYYANAMTTYLEVFEHTIGQKPQMSWTFMGATHRQSHEDVPKQLGGDDCGVYVCLLADLISQRWQLNEADHGWIG